METKGVKFQKKSNTLGVRDEKQKAAAQTMITGGSNGQVLRKKESKESFMVSADMFVIFKTDPVSAHYEIGNELGTGLDLPL